MSDNPVKITKGQLGNGQPMDIFEQTSSDENEQRKHKKPNLVMPSNNEHDDSVEQPLFPPIKGAVKSPSSNVTNQKNQKKIENRHNKSDVESLNLPSEAKFGVKSRQATMEKLKFNRLSQKMNKLISKTRNDEDS